MKARGRKKSPFDIPGRRPWANFTSMKQKAAVDDVVDLLHVVEPGDPSKNEVKRIHLRLRLREAVVAADRAAIANAERRHLSDYGQERAKASQGAFRKLSKLIAVSSFLPDITHAGPFVEREDPVYADKLRALVDALNDVGLLKLVLDDETDKLKRADRVNPGAPYLNGLFDELVAFWVRMPEAKKTPSGKRSESSAFWRFAEAVVDDLQIDAPIENPIKEAVKRHKGRKPPL